MYGYSDAGQWAREHAQGDRKAESQEGIAQGRVLLIVPASQPPALPAAHALGMGCFNLD